MFLSLEQSLLSPTLKVGLWLAIMSPLSWEQCLLCWLALRERAVNECGHATSLDSLSCWEPLLEKLHANTHSPQHLWAHFLAPLHDPQSPRGLIPYIFLVSGVLSVCVLVCECVVYTHTQTHSSEGVWIAGMQACVFMYKLLWATWETSLCGRTWQCWGNVSTLEQFWLMSNGCRALTVGLDMFHAWKHHLGVF